jgi:hypothetical protein
MLTHTCTSYSSKWSSWQLQQGKQRQALTLQQVGYVQWPHRVVLCCHSAGDASQAHYVHAEQRSGASCLTTGNCLPAGTAAPAAHVTRALAAVTCPVPGCSCGDSSVLAGTVAPTLQVPPLLTAVA